MSNTICPYCKHDHALEIAAKKFVAKQGGNIALAAGGVVASFIPGMLFVPIVLAITKFATDYTIDKAIEEMKVVTCSNCGREYNTSK